VPAVDNCEPIVVAALRKDGWLVSNQPFFIGVGKAALYAHIRVYKNDNGVPKEIIVVEVKCFANRHAYLDDLYGAVGQYLVYRKAMRFRQVFEPLYLALPTTAYTTLFQRNVVVATIREIQMKLLVVDFNKEEISSWLE
jgi:hypothetical protein